MGEFVVISATVNLDSYKGIVRHSKSHNIHTIQNLKQDKMSEIFCLQ